MKHEHWKRSLYTRAQAFLVAVYLVSMTGCEKFETRYATLADAERDGAVARGWVPDALPASSRDIREWHDLDTNRVFGMLRFDRESADAIRRTFRAAQVGDLGPVHARVGDPRWWPAELEGKLDQSQLLEAGFSFYATQRFTVAVQEDSGTLYFWNSGS